MLGIVYRTIATHLIRKAGYTRTTAYTGAVTLIQRFGSALNLNIHFHMLFLDGVYVDDAGSTARFRWVKAPTDDELTQLTHTIAHRIARYLERQGLLERDSENSYLAPDGVDEDPMNELRGHSMMCKDARMPRSAGMRKSGHLPHRSSRLTGLRWAPSKAARFLRCKLCLATNHTNPLLPPRAKLLASRCMPVWRPRTSSGTSWNVCAAPSQDRRYPRNACH